MMPKYVDKPRLCLFAALCAAALVAGCADGDTRTGDAGTAAVLPEDSAPPTVDSLSEEPSAPAPLMPEPAGDEDLRAAAGVLGSYYAAIREGALERAYLLWSDSGRASGQTLAEFRQGYAETAAVELVTREGTIEGAAGSRYAEFPVQITATTRDGATQRFAGSYVLRRSVVDGASAEQRAWRIYSADIRQTQ